MTTRKPIVAGQFYPGHKDRIISAIEDSFVSRFGPGKLPGTRGSGRKVFGVIVPHAGYTYSGAGQAWCYKEIAEGEFPDVYVILGVNHSSPETCSSSEDWETPSGPVACDTELVMKMQEKGLPVSNGTHHYEHSIEVQLPFLQYVSKDNASALRIAPIMIADENYAKWGKVIQDSIKELGRKAVIICSSDFTHYGPNYGYVPFKNPEKNMEAFDMKAIKHILATNSKAFLEHCEDTGATICGKDGIAVLCWLAQGEKVKLLKYYTSADVVGDWNNSVGYAAIVVR
jgi:AmmeMemoRadiSam system protein B